MYILSKCTPMKKLTILNLLKIPLKSVYIGLTLLKKTFTPPCKIRVSLRKMLYNIHSDITLKDDFLDEETLRITEKVCDIFSESQMIRFVYLYSILYSFFAR